MAEDVIPETNTEQQAPPLTQEDVYRAAGSKDPRLADVNTGGSALYNPSLHSGAIKKEMVGNPISGVNPGLKISDISTSGYANAVGNYIEQSPYIKQDPSSYMKPYSYNGDFDGANFDPLKYFDSLKYHFIILIIA